MYFVFMQYEEEEELEEGVERPSRQKKSRKRVVKQSLLNVSISLTFYSI